MLYSFISLFTILLYTVLGIYVLSRNPHERTNKIFALIMIVFIIWSMGMYSLGIISDNPPLKEIALQIKLQLSGFVLSLTIFVFFTLSVTKAGKTFNSLFYLIILPSLYLLYLVQDQDNGQNLLMHPGIALFL